MATGSQSNRLTSVAASVADAPRALPLSALSIAAAVGYYAGARLGMALTFSSEPVSTLWPANAVLLSILLLTAPRKWWVLLLCTFPAHLLAEIDAGVPFVMSVLWFVSNCAEATLGAALLLHFLGGAPRLDRVRDVSVLVLAAGITAPVASSFLDSAFVALTGWRYSTYWQVWQARTLSNSLAALIIIPLAASVCAPGVLTRLRHTRAAEWIEAGLLLLGLSVASLLVFLQPSPANQSPVVTYAPLPFLIWAAVRRGTGLVALCTAILALFAIQGLLHGRGPFIDPNPERAARALQTSLVIAVASLMLLAAALAELRDARGLALSRLEQLDLALAAAQMGTWEWDFERERVSWTSIDAQGTGLRSGALSSRALLKRVERDDRALLMRAFDDTTDDGTFEAEFRIHAENGTLLWIRCEGRAVQVDPSAPRRMIGVYRDVTRRKAEDQELDTQREQIARLNRASLLGVLSGALAHDLSQPLTGILSNAEAALATLRQKVPDLQEVDAALVDIVSDNLRIMELIRDIRALFERGEVSGAPMDVNECVRSTLNLERGYIIGHRVTVDTRMGVGLPNVMMNAAQLQQVLINLIVNACEAMEQVPESERRLEVSTSARDQQALEVMIADNGPGMESPDSVFDTFFTTKPHGVGLGLAISRMIVTAHGGKLWATNKPIRGATLHLLLPAATQDAASAASQESGVRA